MIEKERLALRYRGETAAAVALWMAVLASAGFALVFWVMWAPPFLFGQVGWLFLYPLFVLLWVPVELGAIISTVIGVFALARGTAATGVTAVFLGIAVFIAVLSLPMLWFGMSPRFLFVGAVVA